MYKHTQRKTHHHCYSCWCKTIIIIQPKCMINPITLLPFGEMQVIFNILQFQETRLIIDIDINSDIVWKWYKIYGELEIHYSLFWRPCNSSPSILCGCFMRCYCYWCRWNLMLLWNLSLCKMVIHTLGMFYTITINSYI